MPTEDWPRTVSGPKVNPYVSQRSNFDATRNTDGYFQATLKTTQESSFASFSFIRRFYGEQKFSEEEVNIIQGEHPLSFRMKYVLTNGYISMVNKRSISKFYKIWISMTCMKFQFPLSFYKHFFQKLGKANSTKHHN